MRGVSIRLLGFSSSVRKQRRRTAAARSRRAILEPLEPRDLLALVTWDGGGGDLLWHNSLNWSTDALPAAGDDVEIHAGPGAVIHSQGTDTVRSLVANSPLTLSGGDLTVDETLDLTDSFLLSGGTLTASSAVLRASTNQWTSGTLRGGTMTIGAGGVLELSGNGSKSLDGQTLNLAGTAIYRDDGNLHYGNDPVLNIQPSGLFEVRNNGDLPNGYMGGGPLVINNAGTFRKSAETGVTRVGAEFNNSGLVDLRTGTVELAGGGTSGGAFHSEAGAALVVSHDHAFTAGVQFTGAGTSRLTAGTISINGSLSPENLVLDGATVTGTSNINGHLDWTMGTLRGGTMTIGAGGVLDVSGNGTKSLDGQTLNLAGTAIYRDDGNLNYGNNPVLNIQPSGLFEVRNNGDLPNGYMGGGPLVINNAGTFRKSAETGVTRVGAEFNNSGLVDLRTGTVELAGGGTSGGAFHSEAGAALVVSHDHAFTAGVQFTGAGSSRLTAGTISVNGSLSPENLVLDGATVTGTSNINGHLAWTMGTLRGGTMTIGAGGVLELSGNGTKSLDGQTLNLAGTAIYRDDGNLNYGNNPVLNIQPSGLFEVRNNGDLPNGYMGGGPLVINNAGTFRKSAETGVTRVGAEFNNSGLVDVRTGTVELAGGGTSGGAFHSEAGAALVVSHDHAFTAGVQFTGAGSSRLTAGTISVNGSLSPENLVLDGATVTGTSNINGHLAWTMGTLRGGTMTIDAGGVLELSGNGTKSLDGQTLNLAGTAIYRDDGNLNYGNNPVLNIQPSGLFEVRNNGDLPNGYMGGGPLVINNAGTFRKSVGDGTTTIGGRFNNTGVLDVQSGTLFLPDSGDRNGNFRTEVLGTLRFQTLQPFATDATVTGAGVVVFANAGTELNRQSLEVMSRDLGNSSPGFSRNFELGTLTVESSSYVRLVDETDNSLDAPPEALYVNNLIVTAGSTLDLNQLHVYTRASEISGTVIGGSIETLPDGGPLTLGTFASGAIANAGEMDEWTFFGRAGQAASIIVNIGNDVPPTPLNPHLDNAKVTILAPDGQIVATAMNGVSGAPVTILGASLATDGTYRVEVQASDSHASGVGNYMIAAYNVTIDNATIDLNQQRIGHLENPYSIDRWTFSAEAGEQIQLDLVNASVASLAFDLAGPNGYVGFTGLASDSPLVTLPASGTYVLTVHSPQSKTGAYAFTLRQTALADLALGTSYLGNLSGSGQAQLFRVNVPNGQQLLVELNDSNTADHNELYLKSGSPPTRDDYQYRYSKLASSSQQIVAPDVSTGTWYILVYGAAVPAPSNFTLKATAANALLTGVSPTHDGNGHDTQLTITGAGFLDEVYIKLSHGNWVGIDGPFYRTARDARLVAADGTKYPMTVIGGNGTSLAVTIAAGSVPAGVYTVQVERQLRWLDREGNVGSGTSLGVVDLPDAFRMVEGGVGLLRTSLSVPNPIGFHIASTISVQYTNVGDAVMPAPLLVLTATQNGKEGALLTLDPALVVSGFWTSATPDGYGQSVQFLASGATPGLLAPGETATVPVYYAGWLTGQWDFSRPPIVFTLSTFDNNAVLPVDWVSLKDELQPTSIGDEGWNAIFPNLVAQLGTTWGSYLDRLDGDAQYLASLGETVTDIRQLFGFELQQANGFSPLASLAGSTDALMTAPGFDLGFNRSFAPTILSRNRIGRFGWGWSDDWETSLTTESDGTVVVNGPSGSQRRFQPDRRGGYLAQPGDQATLAIAAGGYRLTELNGQVTSYNTNGSFNFIQDSNGNRITASYANGRVTVLTHSSGQFLTLDYNAAGRLRSMTDSAGRTTNYSYDPTDQYLVATVGYDGRTTSYSYDTGNNPTTAHALLAVTHADGTHDFFSYDSSGNLADVHRDDGVAETTFTYNFGQVVATDALGGVTKSSFDHRGLLVQAEDQQQNRMRFTFDDQRHLVKTTDAIGQIYTNAFDTRGNLLTSTDPLGHTVSYAYLRASNRLASVTDAKGNAIRYGYDGQGNLTTTTFADGTVESVAYDPIGNVLDTTNRRGQVLHYTYNSAGNVLSKTFADGSQATYAYDARENLIHAIDSSGTVSLTYDSQDRLTQIDYPDSRFLHYSYDLVGRRTLMVDQTGFTVAYEYDVLGRLASLTDGAGEPIVTYAYDVLGRLSHKDNGNHTYSTYAYDVAGNLVELANFAPDGTFNSRFVYSYDALGRRVVEVTLDGSWTYTYDAIGQLTHAVFAATNPAVDDQDLAYVYDAAGNRTQTIINGVTTNYTANHLNEYTQVGDTTYAFDPDGNMLSATGTTGTTTYAYSQQNRLTGVTGPQGSWTYQYDALGNRVATTHAGATTQYLIDPAGLGNVVAMYDTADALTSHYTYGIGLASQVNVTTGVAYYDFDAIGSTAGLTNVAGGLVNAYQFLPFGIMAHSSPDNFSPFKYVGQWGVLDDSAGASSMGVRTYESNLGRFRQADPIGIVGGINLYSYATNSPIVKSDSSGLAPGKYILIVPVIGKFLRDQIRDELFKRIFGIALITSPFTLIIDNIMSPPGLNESEGAPGDTCSPRHPCMRAPHPGEFPPDLEYHSAKELFSPLGTVVPLVIPIPPVIPKNTDITTSVNSSDPNAKFGPAGFGSQNFVDSKASFPYRITFENDPAATAPAQRVEISDQLDNHVDWSSFQLTGAGFGDINVTVPPNSQYFQASVPMTFNGRTFDVQVSLDFDSLTGLLVAVFQAVDPNTSLPPDVLTGFLPPENGTGRGQGYVSYVVLPKPNLPTGTQVRNVALVTFDLGETIATDQVAEHDPSQGVDPSKQSLATIDAAGPTSMVAPLPLEVYARQFPVTWLGEDDAGGSGVVAYDVFVATDSGPFVLWRKSTSATESPIDLPRGHHYAFYSVARDGVGHVENSPSTAQAETTYYGPAWWNPRRDIDVSDDGIVAPIDALLVINELNLPTVTSVGGALPATPPSPGFQFPFFDVNGDGFVAPIDALLVINFLNEQSGAEGAEDPTQFKIAVDSDGSSTKPFAAILPTAMSPSPLAMNSPAERREPSIVGDESGRSPIRIVAATNDSLCLELASTRENSSLRRGETKLSRGERREMSLDFVDGVFAMLGRGRSDENFQDHRPF